ncbi:nucleoside diphosphate kinase regulator [Altericroceibacterium endophyticum]|uniref:Nucleoside diphosphate kinase regulator n=1 Tax=Altericroceibacterium endophyticum TaxID=1808508 RepID=A0A6I4T4S8_9SPHN|nr:nucleoside diphosphate kinase regulator [Altericroceibacterium endophyticum]MXO64920.1 nucleoside diphosphate kinase regulator [Altericroceibacterium endophyticum]
MTNQKTPRRPAIMLTEKEADSLANLALGVEKTSPQICELLLDEIGRAKLVPESRMPDDVIRIGSTAEFVDEATGAVRSMQLVYPRHARIEENRISILSLVGCGLIGLRVGQSIMWPDRSGQKRRLSIRKVKQQSVETDVPSVN